MEGGGLRDINELLLNGYFKTSRAKSSSRSVPAWNSSSLYLTSSHSSTPISNNAPSFLKVSQREPPRERSRSRGPRRPPPPRPTVEDEAISLAKESYKSPRPSYDPPLRGIIDQNPIILEAAVTDAEAARLHAAPCPKEKDDNPERRFVYIPKSDTDSSHSENEAERKRRERRKESRLTPKQEPKKEERREDPRPPIERRRSRQDLPSLETRVPREVPARDIPPQFRRSASAFAATPTEKGETPKVPMPRTPTGEYFLSPEVNRQKDYFGTVQSTPRYPNDMSARQTGTPVDKRNSGSFSGSRPTTPSSDKRNSGNFESGRRSRRNTNEKLTRPRQLSEEYWTRQSDRQASTHSHSDRQSGRSSRSSIHSTKRHDSSSDDDIADSDSDHRRRRHRDHDSRKLRPDTEFDRTTRSQSKSNNSPIHPKPISRHTSPLPSPNVSPSNLPRADQFERSETFPQSRRNSSRPVSPLSAPLESANPARLNPSTASSRPISRPSSAIPIPLSKTPSAAPPASLPIPPARVDVYSPGETRRSPALPQFDDKRPSSANPTASTQPPWQPPSFQPPSNSLEKPAGFVRRHSEDVERGSIAPLPSCPRTTCIRGRNDWLTLPQCPSFDICPSCYDSTIAPTEFRNHFVPAPFRPPETEVLCDFGSSPWYRIAWLLTRKERRRDLKLFYGLANIAANCQPCLGKHDAIRTWHSIIDPKSGQPIRNFDVCYSCVKSIETLLPPIRGIFVRTDHHGLPGAPRVCDLRFDSKRFIQYFDALETTADRADYDGGPPDTRDLASLARRFALVEECQGEKDLTDHRWHIITQLPEFTVCEECFDEVVWPELEERKAIPMMFNKNLQKLPKASCQLYSPKTRGIFRIAVDSDDYKMLAAKARERKVRENAFKKELVELRRQSKGNPGAAKEIERLREEWGNWE